MYKSEPRVNLTLINHVTWYMSSEHGLLGPIGVVASLESNSKIYLTFH